MTNEQIDDFLKDMYDQVLGTTGIPLENEESHNEFLASLQKDHQKKKNSLTTRDQKKYFSEKAEEYRKKAIVFAENRLTLEGETRMKHTANTVFSPGQ